jgi:hypothetical protein
VQDSPFQKGEQMDILKEKIDANSFQTMKHIIFLTSTKNDKIRYFEKEEADKRFLPIGKRRKTLILFSIRVRCWRGMKKR